MLLHEHKDDDVNKVPDLSPSNSVLVLFADLKLANREFKKTTTARHVGRHQTMAFMNKAIELCAQNTIWLVSRPSSAKQREMSIL